MARRSPSSRSNFSSLNRALSPDTSRRTKSVMVTREPVMSFDSITALTPLPAPKITESKWNG